MILTLRKKMFLSYSAIIALFVITVVVSAFLSERMVELTNESSVSGKRMEVLQRLNLFARTANDNGAHYLLAPLYVEADYESRFNSNVRYVNAEMRRLVEMTSDAQALAQIDRFKQKWADYLTHKRRTMALKQQGEAEKAREAYAKDSFDPIAFALHAFFKNEQARVDRNNNEIRGIGNLIVRVNYTMAGSGIALSLLIAITLSNHLLRRIRLLKSSAQKVAEGDLQVADLHFKGRDELFELAEAFNRMTHSLRTVIDSNAFLMQISRRDALTGIANRRCYDDTLEREWRRLVKEAKPISLILFDIDYFKRYNDHYGHQAGDECLKLVAAILQEQVGPADLAARYGGEEFVVLLPNQDRSDASGMATRFQSALAERAIPHIRSEVSEYVTVSIGIASASARELDHPRRLLLEADQALYAAKESGRNRICFYDPAIAGKGVEPHQD
ncbi:diguanylate cyclase domain-containing protein [Paenibacillus aurantiacus]|uniref:Diguanylate cyclase domain-containing protein n=1 Tax=Paenibacillus aurantiacus TaxID=1936118 RepID=A0ABV5KLP8_9BACL